MKAMIFAAGLGTRLRPHTNDRPKALVEVNGTPLLELAIRRLVAAGCRDIIVNVHHFAAQIIGFLRSKDNFGINIALSDEREMVLETGGGLQKAAWFFADGKTPPKQDFLVLNVDILTNMDLAGFYQKHLASGALATLAVRNRPSSRHFIFDENMRLTGWENRRTGESREAKNQIPNTINHKLSFSGIHAISPRIFEYMPPGEIKFSIIDTYMSAMENETIIGHLHDMDIWLDVGSPASLAEAENMGLGQF